MEKALSSPQSWWRAPELRGLLQAFAALMDQGVVRGDFHPHLLQLHDLGEDVRSPIEKRPRQHGVRHPSAFRVRLPLVGSANLVEAVAGDIEPVLHMVEEPPRQGPNQLLLGLQIIGRRLVVLDPVAVIVGPGPAVYVPAGAVGGLFQHGAVRSCWLGELSG